LLSGILKIYETQLLELNFEGTLDFIRRLPEVRLIQPLQLVVSSLFLSLKHMDEEALFAVIDKLTVAPYLVEMVEKLNSDTALT